MGKLFSPKAAQTPIPQQAAFDTQIDNVAGTKVERVKQPDGTYQLVRSSLPQSPEEAAYTAKLKEIQGQQLDYINRLSGNNPDDLPDDVKQYINDYRTTQGLNIDAAADQGAAQQERALARYGQADSTAASEARSGLAQGVLGQRALLGRDLSTIAQQGRDSALSRAGSLYNLASGALSGQQATQLGSLSTSLNSGYQGQQIGQNYNNSVSATIGANNQARAAAAQQGLSSLSSLVSLAGKAGLAYATGGTSLLADSFLGSNMSGAYNKGFSLYGGK